MSLHNLSFLAHGKGRETHSNGFAVCFPETHGKGRTTHFCTAKGLCRAPSLCTHGKGRKKQRTTKKDAWRRGQHRRSSTIFVVRRLLGWTANILIKNKKSKAGSASTTRPAAALGIRVTHAVEKKPAMRHRSRPLAVGGGRRTTVGAGRVRPLHCSFPGRKCGGHLHHRDRR
jgi:hypothetical protein